jgi:hypothetical protein
MALEKVSSLLQIELLDHVQMLNLLSVAGMCKAFKSPTGLPSVSDASHSHKHQPAACHAEV